MKPQVIHTVQCPLAGFEQVAVTYNLMASEAELDAVTNTLGSEPNNVIVEVHNWPAEYGKDPFGKGAPTLWRVWAVRQGFTEAIKEFAGDPTSWTGLRPSMRPSPTGA